MNEEMTVLTMAGRAFGLHVNLRESCFPLILPAAQASFRLILVKVFMKDEAKQKVP